MYQWPTVIAKQFLRLRLHQNQHCIYFLSDTGSGWTWIRVSLKLLVLITKMEQPKKRYLIAKVIAKNNGEQMYLDPHGNILPLTPPTELSSKAKDCYINVATESVSRVYRHLLDQMKRDVDSIDAERIEEETKDSVQDLPKTETDEEIRTKRARKKWRSIVERRVSSISISSFSTLHTVPSQVTLLHSINEDVISKASEVLKTETSSDDEWLDATANQERPSKDEEGLDMYDYFRDFSIMVHWEFFREFVRQMYNDFIPEEERVLLDAARKESKDQSLKTDDEDIVSSPLNKQSETTFDPSIYEFDNVPSSSDLGVYEIVLKRPKREASTQISSAIEYEVETFPQDNDNDIKTFSQDEDGGFTTVDESIITPRKHDQGYSTEEVYPQTSEPESTTDFEPTLTEDTEAAQSISEFSSKFSLENASEEDASQTGELVSSLRDDETLIREVATQFTEDAGSDVDVYSVVFMTDPEDEPLQSSDENRFKAIYEKIVNAENATSESPDSLKNVQSIEDEEELRKKDQCTGTEEEFFCGDIIGPLKSQGSDVSEDSSIMENVEPLAKNTADLPKISETEENKKTAIDDDKKGFAQDEEGFDSKPENIKDEEESTKEYNTKLDSCQENRDDQDLTNEEQSTVEELPEPNIEDLQFAVPPPGKSIPMDGEVKKDDEVEENESLFYAVPPAGKSIPMDREISKESVQHTESDKDESLFFAVPPPGKSIPMDNEVSTVKKVDDVDEDLFYAVPPPGKSIIQNDEPDEMFYAIPSQGKSIPMDREVPVGEGESSRMSSPEKTIPTDIDSPQDDIPETNQEKKDLQTEAKESVAADTSVVSTTSKDASCMSSVPVTESYHYPGPYSNVPYHGGQPGMSYPGMEGYQYQGMPLPRHYMGSMGGMQPGIGFGGVQHGMPYGAQYDRGTGLRYSGVVNYPFEGMVNPGYSNEPGKSYQNPIGPYNVQMNIPQVTSVQSIPGRVHSNLTEQMESINLDLRDTGKLISINPTSSAALKIGEHIVYINYEPSQESQQLARVSKSTAAISTQTEPIKCEIATQCDMEENPSKITVTQMTSSKPTKVEVETLTDVSKPKTYNQLGTQTSSDREKSGSVNVKRSDSQSSIEPVTDEDVVDMPDLDLNPERIVLGYFPTLTDVDEVTETGDDMSAESTQSSGQQVMAQTHRPDARGDGFKYGRRFITDAEQPTKTESELVGDSSSSRIPPPVLIPEMKRQWTKCILQKELSETLKKFEILQVDTPQKELSKKDIMLYKEAWEKSLKLIPEAKQQPLENQTKIPLLEAQNIFKGGIGQLDKNPIKQSSEKPIKSSFDETPGTSQKSVPVADSKVSTGAIPKVFKIKNGGEKRVKPFRPHRESKIFKEGRPQEMNKKKKKDRNGGSSKCSEEFDWNF